MAITSRLKTIRRLGRAGLATAALLTLVTFPSVATAAPTTNDAALKAIGEAQIAADLLNLADAIRLLNAKYKTDHNQPPTDVGLVAWDDPGFVAYLGTLDLAQTGSGGTFLRKNETWSHFLSRQAQRSQSKIATTLSIYTPYLNPDTIEKTEAVRNAETVEYLANLNSVYNPTPVADDGPIIMPIKGYQGFVIAYRALCVRFQQDRVSVPAGVCN